MQKTALGWNLQMEKMELHPRGAVGVERERCVLERMMMMTAVSAEFYFGLYKNFSII